jgi:hypothetical protein
MRSSYIDPLGGLVFSVVLVYLLIVVNFQSWLDPIIIITALAGIVLFLFVTDTTLGVHFLTLGLIFANSDALFPPLEPAASIKAEYDRQCKMLCYAPYPSWEEIQAGLQGLRHLL